MFKVNYKNTRTSFWRFYCSLWTYFTPFSSVSIVHFEQANVSWAISMKSDMHFINPLITQNKVKKLKKQKQKPTEHNLKNQ